uniref:Abortive infection bacteriophage resistance protein n=1 Tax=Candidatus Kentrum sp. FW TaxID=2126338 RepID=A0A450U008_9GAMM|nr:MAG: Abortive infection bacteriophage resistance protein [Candidatus Kentron sp. FW]
MKRVFQKPPTTYSQQVELLQRRGMRIDNPTEAEFYLQHLNYYRLSPYWLPFEADHATHCFRPNTRFTDVLNLYVFDRELRLLVLDAIERIEVSMRGQWAYQMAHHHGAHAHLDPELARNRQHWEENRAKLMDEIKRSHETFIGHFNDNYREKTPPVWAVCEVMSLGQLSRWYANLKPMSIRRAIANIYAMDQKMLESWLRHLAHVRNVCAHHSRLWNREFIITSSLPGQKPKGLARQCQKGSRKLYNTLVLLLHCLDRIAPNHHWRSRLKELLSKDSADTAAMGFPAGWEKMAIWHGVGL